MTPDTDDTDTEQRIHRTDEGVSITTEIKRGTGTRDQDKHVLKAKGETPEQAVAYHCDGIEYLTGDRPDEQPIIDRIRDIQPGDDDD